MATEGEILKVYNFSWAGKEKPPGALMKWTALLKAYPYDVLVQAVKQEARENEWPKLPRIIELAEQLNPERDDKKLTAEEAFHIVRLAVRKYGQKEFRFVDNPKLEGKKLANQAFLNYPTLRAYLRVTGLYDDLCNAEGEYQREAVRRQFLKGWETYAKRIKLESEFVLLEERKLKQLEAENNG